MSDKITELAETILGHPETHISAEARNALHGVCLGHPWAEGKDRSLRLREMRAALAGRDYPAIFWWQLERIKT